MSKRSYTSDKHPLSEGVPTSVGSRTHGQGDHTKATPSESGYIGNRLSRWLLNRRARRVGISPEPLSDGQMERAAARSDRERWKDIVP